MVFSFSVPPRALSDAVAGSYRFLMLSIVLVSSGLLGCSSDTEDVAMNVDLAPFAPLPLTVDVDVDKAELGRLLYHDPTLSADGSVACATCHVVAEGGDDGLPTSLGIGGQVGPINAPTVLNAGFNLAQFWDGRAADLAAQAAGPVTNPKEMGDQTWDAVVARLEGSDDPTGMPYRERFAAVFGAKGISEQTTTEAIAEFERTLITPNDRLDQFLRGNRDALNEVELTGMSAFVALGCADCHFGPALGGEGYTQMNAAYFEGREPTGADLGRFNVTKDPADRFVFKTPLLRNIARTAPYFHDGSVKTLEEAVEKMARFQLGVMLAQEDIDAIAAFLRTLDGELPNVAL